MLAVVLLVGSACTELVLSMMVLVVIMFVIVLILM